MEMTFYKASAFDQDISGWAVDSVGKSGMENMFNGASAFNQDLGWCLDVEFEGDEFSGTPCASTSCGAQQNAAGTCAPTLAPTRMPTTAACMRRL